MHTNSQHRATMKCAHCGKPIACDGDNGGTKVPPCCSGQVHNRTCEPPPRCPDPGTGDVPQDESPPKVKITPTRPGQDPQRPPRDTPADQRWFRDQVRGTLTDGPRFGPRKDEYPFSWCAAPPVTLARDLLAVCSGNRQTFSFCRAWMRRQRR